MVGSAEQVAEQIKTKVLDAGIDGVIISPVDERAGIPARRASPRVAEELKPLLEG